MAKRGRKPKSERQFKPSEEVYLSCNKCEKPVLKVMGAIAHARGHGLSLTSKDIGRHFSEIKNPPQAVIDELTKKKKYRNTHNARQKIESNNGKKINFKCKACGRVMEKKNSLWGHASKVHHKPLSEVGYEETTEPPTRSVKSGSIAEAPLQSFDLPQMLGITKAEAIEDGVIVTAQIKLPSDFLASIISPTLLPTK